MRSPQRSARVKKKAALKKNIVPIKATEVIRNLKAKTKKSTLSRRAEKE